MDIQVVKGETLILVIDPRDTRGQGWILNSDIIDVILSISESETSAHILQLKGKIEQIGDSVDEPGKVSILFHSVDTKDLETGDYWYDVILQQKGHWLDIVEFKDNYILLGFGKVKDEDGNFIDVESQWVELPYEVNFIQVSKAGEVIISEGDYQKEGENYINYNLYRVVVLDGIVIDIFPYSGWFEEGTHSGLDFYYGAGYILNNSNEIIEVEGGSITLKNNIVNYIEVSKDGVVSSNIKGFTEGRFPLFVATTEEGEITETERQENSFFFDDRSIFVRGDKFYSILKKQCRIVWTPTKIE